MQASIRQYRCRPDQVPELMHRVDEIFVPRVEEMEGFVGYDVIDCGDGLLMSLTFCRDQAAIERSVELAAEFVRDDLADFEVERLEALAGDVSVSRAREAMLEPAHA
jgi:hypothetical protein